MRQKFGILKFVRVCDVLPTCMSHFPSGFDAIVCGTYSQIERGTDIKNYAIYRIEGGKVVNRISWYHEEHLTLTAEQDTDKAEQMIEDYNFRG